MSPGDVDMRRLALHGFALALDAQRVGDGDLRPAVALEAARRRFERLGVSERAAGVLARAMVGRDSHE